MVEFFTEVAEPIRYAGPDSDDPLTFRWYDADRRAAVATAGSLAATPAGMAVGATTDG